jgi:tRNA(Ile)-lysidine synthase
VVIVGVSGGPDSLCLLHLLNVLAPQHNLRLRVAHLHHGLRGADADADARFVQQTAQAMGLPYDEGRADVRRLADEEGRSLEEAARQARYAFLWDAARSAGAQIVAVGHNAGDQAETVLMHFLRGSGVSGLRGMLPRTCLSDYRLLLDGGAEARARDQAPVWLIRPLLQTDRDRIAAYCEAHGLQPRYDLSNEDATFFRNRLRHELIPLLESYNPAFRDVMTRTASVMAGDADVLQERARAAWENMILESGPAEVVFDLALWRQLPIGLQRATLREAVRRLRRSLRDLHWEHIEHAVLLAREGHAGQSAMLPAGLSLILGYHRLRIASVDAPCIIDTPQVATPQPLNLPGVTVLDGGWRVLSEGTDAAASFSGAGKDPWQAWLDADATGSELLLRPRQPGDRFQPQGMNGHSMKLNEFMINAKLPREARARWPLLTGRQGIAWVCGLRLDERAAVTASSTRVWRIRFER